MGLVSIAGGIMGTDGGEGGFGDGEVEFVGTDGTTAVGTSLVFKSASDSNVVVNVSEGANGEVVAEVGVYYA